MLTSEIAKFGEAMEKLRACYQDFPIDANDWKRRIGSYFEQLAKHQTGDVMEALVRAPKPDFYPDRFPTAGQLHQVTQFCRRERAESESERAKERANQTESERERAEYLRVPLIPEQQQAWIAEGASPFEKLGRLWQCESRTLGIRPSDRTPDHIHAKRMKQLRQVWEKWESGGYRTAPTSGEPQTEGALPSLASGLSESPPSSASSTVRGQSHGDGCVCESCYAKVQEAARKAGLPA